MLVILISSLCSGYIISQIPESGSPPDPRVLVASAYDSNSNRIIYLGGEGLKGANDLSTTLYAYSLNTFIWSKIPSKMGIPPPGLKDINIYFRKSDNKIFVFGGLTSKGANTVMYSFDLKRFFWNVEIMSGDVMDSTTRSSFSFFNHNDTEYIAIYGGYSERGLIDDFYLIDVEKMFVKQMPKNGDHPGIRIQTQNFYYNETYYMYGVNLFFSNLSLFKFEFKKETWSFVQTYGQKPPDLVYHEIFIRGDSFYLINGVITGIIAPHLSYYRFDFLTSNWVMLESSLNIFEWSYYHTVTEANGKVYKAFGKSLRGYLNSVTIIELGDQVLNTVLSPQYISPEPRRNHLSFVSNQNMYIYGGITEEGTFLKDMWKYDFESKVWNKIDYSGTPPLYRENMAFVPVFDIGIYVFGGQSGDDFYNDVYYYEQKNSVWIKYKDYENAPNPRYGSCIVHGKQKLYVIGGQNNQFTFSDIWRFDSLENTFTLLENRLPFSIAFHKCWSVERGNQVYIYVMGGRSFEGIETKRVHRISVTIYSDTEYLVKTDEMLFEYYLSLYYTALVVSGNSAHMIIGLPFEGAINTTIISYDICKNQLSYINLPYQYGVFGHSAVHYGKSIYVFGGGYSIQTRQIDNSATNAFYNFSLPEILNCSLGLYDEDSECKSCPMGTYGEFDSTCKLDEYCSVCSVIKNSCKRCDVGKYSDTKGSASKHRCSLCSKGQFADQEGSIKCLDCVQSGFCPIGSSKPLKFIDNYEFYSVQPAIYESQQNFSSFFINNLWYSVASMIIFLILIFLFSNSARKRLYYIDIFTDAHPQELNIPVVYRKTNFGGLFSIIFFLFFIAILINAYIGFVYDNVVEIRTLVPLVTVYEESEAEEFIVYSKFHTYGGECIGNGEGNCNTELIINDNGLSYDKREIECELVENHCLVKMTYQKIQISGDFKIYYKMKEILSYTNLMTVNISVSTGIPGGMSENFIPIYPSQDSYIFRGTTPTVLSFEMIPTFFKSESSKWPSSSKGFHLRYDQNPQYGSMIDSDQLYTTSYVYLKLEFQISNTALNIFRELKITLYLLFSGLLGMIAGVLESLGTVMGHFEDVLGGFELKLTKKKNLGKIIHDRENFNDFLFTREQVQRIRKARSFLKPECVEIMRSSSRFDDSTEIHRDFN